MNLSDLSEKLNLEGKLAALDSLKKRFFPTDGGVPVQGARVEADVWADRRPESGLDSTPEFITPESDSPADPEGAYSGAFSDFLSSADHAQGEDGRDPLFGSIAVEAQDQPASETADVSGASEAGADEAAPGDVPEEGESADSPGEDGETAPKAKRPAPTPEQLRARRRAFQQTAALLWSGSIVLGILATAVSLIYAMVS